MKHHPRVLFILRAREDYGDSPYEHGYGKGLSSGLLNSAKFVVDMLARHHISVKLVQVLDNNFIDKEVHQYKPDIVIIEALWVVPEKFDVLQRLHPHVKWIVRGHSEIPFLAHEGIAIGWLTRYVQFKNVSIAANSESSLHDLREIIHAANPDWSARKVREKVVFLPNYYPHNHKHPKPHKNSEFIDIACFGAIRPLKNQLIQAVAAIRYARETNKQLRFHINATRNEQGGNNVLKNIQALFAATEYELVEHDWLPHHEFIRLIARMDISLCVSFSESFCIVAADSVATGVPIVGSNEISFISSTVQASTTDSEDIVRKMRVALDWTTSWITRTLNSWALRRHCKTAEEVWLRYIHD